MAKKKTEIVSYLYGTFIGKGLISISADTSDKEVKAFLKENPELEKRITDNKLIEEQRKLMK